MLSSKLYYHSYGSFPPAAISTNYSLYAFNQSEYVADDIEENEMAEEVNGDWLNGLFHKNDGYFTPLVITPFRETGNIDVEKENRLASQRIMALALLQQAQVKPYSCAHRHSLKKGMKYCFQIQVSYHMRPAQN